MNASIRGRFFVPVDAPSSARDTSVHMDAEKPPVIEAPRPRYGRSGSRELSALRAAVEEARALPDATPEESGEKERKVKIAERRVDLFLYEHDAAGAFKFKRFARETLAALNEKGVERTPDGRLTFSGPEKGSRLLFVNLGELDRFNKEGGSHAAGDAVLVETVRAIEAALERAAETSRANGGDMKYSIYRYAGNDYAVRIDGADQETFDAVANEIRGAQPRVEGVEEPAPIVAEGFSMAEALEILNDAEEQSAEEDRVGPEDGRKLARSYIDVMRRRADYALDVDKFMKRVDRVRGKIASGDEAGARAFFDNYAAKGLKNIGKLGEEGVDIGFDQLKDPDIAHLEALAHDQAAKQLGLRTAERVASRVVVEAMAAERGKRGAEHASATEFFSGVRLADIPTGTSGHMVMAEKRSAYERAVADGVEGDELELVRLELQIEEARRDGSTEDGKFTGTGLLDRGSCYERLESAFENGEGKSLVFIDMGFLKYFDKAGGRDVGNNALRLAASLMERASVKSGIKAEAFRYGGDEFTIVIDGGERDVDTYVETLSQLRDEAGAVPQGVQGGKEGYVPTKLSFNYGTADTAVAERAYADLVARGLIIEDGASAANRKAEILTLIADKAIEEQKAVERMELLATKMKAAKDAGDTLGMAHAEALLKYSAKAIRAEAGGEGFLRSLVNGPDAPQDDAEWSPWAKEKIAAWAAERPSEAKENSERENKRDVLIDALVEKYSRIAYYERLLRQEREHNKDLDVENHSLRKKIDILEKELKQLLGVRKELGS